MKTAHKVENSDNDIIAKDTATKCNDCDAGFTSKTTLINHKENTHKAGKAI